MYQRLDEYNQGNMRLEVCELNDMYHVRIDNFVNATYHPLLETDSKDAAVRFFELIKAAYEELIY